MSKDSDDAELGRLNAQLHANTFDKDHASAIELLDGAVEASANDLTLTADVPVTDSYRWAAMVKLLSAIGPEKLSALLAEAVVRLARQQVPQKKADPS